MTTQEQSLLLDALLDGEISEADFLRLEAELSVDGEVRQAFYRRLQMESLLEELASEAWRGPEGVASGTSHPAAGRGLWITGILIAIAAGLMAVLSLAAWNRDAPADVYMLAANQGDEPSASGFAILSGQTDALWEGEPLASGGLLPSGEIHLVSGLVHVELFSGVQMVIQGDAVFSIDSPMQVSMVKGRARAHVPDPAHGFRIKTAGGDVVDLGTEFTIDVDQNRSNVKVVDGEVELRPRDADVRRLRDGDGLQLTSRGTIGAGPSDAIGLIGPAAFQDALARRQSDQYRSWQEATRTLRQDSRLLAHYTVDPEAGWSRELVNGASADNRPDHAPIAGDGAVVVAEPTQDRWGRSGGALDFSRMGSRVRVVVPGEHRGLTLLCWVKINSLDRWFNSLFLTDGHEGREPHWQIMNDGRLFFSVKPESVDELSEAEQEQQVFYSPPFWDTSMSGQWIMLCTVYDVDQQQVTHYLNGEPISVAPIPDRLLVDSIKIGSASVCNWSQPMYRSDATFVVRNLNGSVDEFALFSGALSSDEISVLFQAGNPNEQ
jgi:hypothetical protein